VRRRGIGPRVLERAKAGAGLLDGIEDVEQIARQPCHFQLLDAPRLNGALQEHVNEERYRDCRHRDRWLAVRFASASSGRK
jgi:hypothetical protein